MPASFRTPLPSQTCVPWPFLHCIPLAGRGLRAQAPSRAFSTARRRALSVPRSCPAKPWRLESYSILKRPRGLCCRSWGSGTEWYDKHGNEQLQRCGILISSYGFALSGPAGNPGGRARNCFASEGAVPVCRQGSQDRSFSASEKRKQGKPWMASLETPVLGCFLQGQETQIQNFRRLLTKLQPSFFCTPAKSSTQPEALVFPKEQPWLEVLLCKSSIAWKKRGTPQLELVPRVVSAACFGLQAGGRVGVSFRQAPGLRLRLRRVGAGDGEDSKRILEMELQAPGSLEASKKLAS